MGAATYLILQIIWGTAPLDDGDGLQHFSIARASFQQHEFWLDHWGKPLFTLLSSPFAQFGFKTFTLFNVLVFILTQVLAFDLFRREKIPSIWIALVPWLFLAIPDYSYTIISGMTEPLFGLLLTVMLWAFLRKKWWVFAVIASFTPFARSEGMLVVLCAAMTLLLVKQWKFIPLLGVAFILYAIVGMWMLNDALWYFHNDPYPAISPYGHGNWYDYLRTYKAHFGIINLLLLPFIGFGLLVWRQHEKFNRTVVILLFTGIYLGIIAVHSYYWANGLKGSAGLTRIALQGLPPFLILAYQGIGTIWKELHVLALAGATLILSYVIVEEVSELGLPYQANPFQITCREVSNYLETEKYNGKVYYLHPLIPYYLGFGSKDQHPVFNQRFQILGLLKEGSIKPGDIIVRDSKFGSVEFGMPLNDLKNHPEIIAIRHFYAADNFPEINGERKGVIIYEIIPEAKQTELPKSNWETHKTSIINRKLHGQKGQEYLDIDPTFHVPNFKGSEHLLKMEFTYIGSQTLTLYFDNGEGAICFTQVKPGQKELILPFNKVNLTGKLFFHNPTKEKVELIIHQSKWESLQDIGYQKI